VRQNLSQVIAEPRDGSSAPVGAERLESVRVLLLQTGATGELEIAIDFADAERIDGNLNEIWLVDRHGIDEHRTEVAMLLKRMLYYGVSRFSPRPIQECEAAEARWHELHIAAPSPGDAA